MTMEWKNVLPADSDCDETDYYQDETDSCCEKTDHYEESTSDLEILESASQVVTRTSIEQCKEDAQQCPPIPAHSPGQP